jgi:hypothetical protein
MCTNPIVELLSTKYDVVAYADDILIGVDCNSDHNQILQEV